jgi:uncharacterized protein
VKFLAAIELGRLCKWLRILGYDCEYFKENSLVSLTIKSLREERVILTRNARLSAGAGYRVARIKSDLVKEQLKQALDDLRLEPEAAAMFTRCVICNLSLDPIEKKEAKDRVPDFVYEANEVFMICPGCRRVYWHGTHWGNVREYLDGIRG